MVLVKTRSALILCLKLLRMRMYINCLLSVHLQVIGRYRVPRMT